MKNNIKKAIFITISILFWILLWQIFAIAFDKEFIFPRLDKTIAALGSLMLTRDFWITILASFARVLLGFVIGALLGIVVAPLTHYFELVRHIISPAMTVIKATPVASFILVLWCLAGYFPLGKASIPTMIGILMVMPIIWQNMTDGYNSISRELDEMCTVFEMSYFKKLRLLIFPTLIKFLIPALVTSSALAWKSGIAAEIIVYAKNSIGKEITDAKNYFESEKMFAWTIVVVLFSIAIEFAIKKLTKAVKKI